MESFQKKSYWNAAGKAGIIFGSTLFLISLIGGYQTIHTEPSGSLLSGSIIASAAGCLFGAFGAVLAVRFYINEYGPEMNIGTGAIIGLVTGLFISLIYQLLGLIWPLIDAAYIENLQRAMIANIEMMDLLPADQKEEMVDAIYTQMQNYYSAGNIINGLLLGFLSYGLLNLLSGLLGAKFMGRTPEKL
ncbi:MAG: DUF4199 family protein [Balneolales bacterium]